MKRNFFSMLMTSALAAISIVIVSCQSAPAPVERSVGFSTLLPEKPDSKWHLGTDSAIQVVKDLDKVWAARDYTAMRTFFTDTSKFYFPDGVISNSPEEFLEKIKAEYELNQDAWTFDYAYSVDMDPANGGEHVQAGFTGTSLMDSVKTKTHFHEWYYVVKGKIVFWRQFALKSKE